MSKNKVSRNFNRIRAIAILSIVIILIVVIVSMRGDFSINTFIQKAAANKHAVIPLLLVLYALKSMAIIIPRSYLYVASSIVLPPAQAFAVNTAGTMIAVSVPFWLGRYGGEEGIEFLKEKYPKVRKLMEYQDENLFVVSFVARIIGVLPGDVLSFYFGACGSNYPVYLVSTMLGGMGHLCVYTFLGDSVLNPGSPQFFALIAVRILISVISIGIAYLVNRYKRRKKLAAGSDTASAAGGDTASAAGSDIASVAGGDTASAAGNDTISAAGSDSAPKSDDDNA